MAATNWFCRWFNQASERLAMMLLMKVPWSHSKWTNGTRHWTKQLRLFTTNYIGAKTSCMERTMGVILKCQIMLKGKLVLCESYCKLNRCTDYYEARFLQGSSYGTRFRRSIHSHFLNWWRSFSWILEGKEFQESASIFWKIGQFLSRWKKLFSMR